MIKYDIVLFNIDVTHNPHALLRSLQEKLLVWNFIEKWRNNGFYHFANVLLQVGLKFSINFSPIFINYFINAIVDSWIARFWLEINSKFAQL